MLDKFKFIKYFYYMYILYYFVIYHVYMRTLLHPTAPARLRGPPSGYWWIVVVEPSGP